MSQPRFEVALGLGYIGQSYHVPVSVGAEAIATLTADELLARFAASIGANTATTTTTSRSSLVTVHVTGVAGTESRALPELEMLARRCLSPASQGERAPTRRGLRRPIILRSLPPRQLEAGHDLRGALPHRRRVRDHCGRRRMRG